MKNTLSIIALIVAVGAMGISGYTLHEIKNFGREFDEMITVKKGEIKNLESKISELNEKIDEKMMNIGDERINGMLSEELKDIASAKIAEISAEAFATKIEEYQAYMMQKQQADEAKAAEAIEEKVIADNMGIGNAPMLGQADAPIKIVEFTDYECPYCQKHTQETFPQLQKYIDDGTVAYYVRDFLIHGDSAKNKAMMAECAKVQSGDEAYFKAHDYMFENLGKEYTSADVAKAAGVDAAKLETCVTNKDTASAVDEDIKDGQAYGITGTPGFFINGTFFRGAYPYSEFEKVINEKLAE